MDIIHHWTLSAVSRSIVISLFSQWSFGARRRKPRTCGEPVCCDVCAPQNYICELQLWNDITDSPFKLRAQCQKCHVARQKPDGDLNNTLCTMILSSVRVTERRLTFIYVCWEHKYIYSRGCGRNSDGKALPPFKAYFRMRWRLLNED